MMNIVASVSDIQSSYAEKIKTFAYPFDIARCGQENYECAENSVHSLAFSIITAFRYANLATFSNGMEI